MYLAMNRFTVKTDRSAEFEGVWRTRDSRLADVPGFVDFKLLKGPTDEDSGHTLYASHTVWETRGHFEDWTRSEHFKAAHRNAGQTSGMYDGHPRFEGFEPVEGM